MNRVHYKEYELAKEPSSCATSFFPCMVVIQARMGSTRLPGKVLRPLLGKPMLAYLVERVQKVGGIEGVVIATSTSKEDDAIEAFCNTNSVHCIRGSQEDVLSRYQATAEAFGLEVLVRITADNPLVDPDLISRAIFAFRDHYEELDYLSNTLRRTYPRGLDIEIFRQEALEKTFFEAKSESDKEHVTPYIIQSGKFRLGNFFQEKDLSRYRLTVDTQEDFQLIKEIYARLYPKNPNFRLREIGTLLQNEPELFEINAHISQKEVK